MDLRLLDRFIAVAEQGSLNKAAHKLHLTQPALSKSIQILEDRYGVVLLDRGPAGVRLTSFGLTLFRHAKLVAAETRRLDGELLSLRNLHAGEINAGVPIGPGYVGRILATATLRLIGQDRRLIVNYTAGARANLMQMLRLGDLDFALTVLTDDGLGDDMVEEELYIDRVALVVASGHQLATHQLVELDQLVRHHWIVLEENIQTEHRLRRMAREARLELALSVLRSSSSLFIKTILTGSDCIGLVRLDTVRSELGQGSLRELPLAPDLHSADLLGRQRIGLVSRSDSSLSTASRVLIEAIRAECAMLPAG